MDGRVADDAVVGPALARLELRLDQRDDRAARRERRRDRGEDLVERDERDVDRSRARPAPAASSRVSAPGVGALHRDDARVAAERLGELAAAHVESVDAGRAALQQDVGEAAGRGADVEADEARGSIPNASSAAASLCPPRLTYGSGASTSTLVVAVDQVARPCGRAGRRRPPPPGPCRPSRAPARGCATRPARARRAAGRAGCACGFAPGRRSDSPAYRGTARCTGTHLRAPDPPDDGPDAVRRMQGALEPWDAIREAIAPKLAACTSCPFRPGSGTTMPFAGRSRAGHRWVTAWSRRSRRVGEPGASRRSDGTGWSSARRWASGSNPGPAGRRDRGSSGRADPGDAPAAIDARLAARARLGLTGCRAEHLERLADLRGEARARRGGGRGAGRRPTRGRRTGRPGCRRSGPATSRSAGSAAAPPRPARARRCRSRRSRRSPRTSRRAACRGPRRGSAGGRAAWRTGR